MINKEKEKEWKNIVCASVAKKVGLNRFSPS
jgi:hypothetical protein